MKVWVFSSSKHVQEAVCSVKQTLKGKELKFPSKALTSLKSGYRSEIDVSEDLGPQEASYYQSLIGILRWMLESGQVDMCIKVAMMSSHLVLLHKGHLEQACHIFGYLRIHHNAEIPFDHTEPDVDLSKFVEQDWGKTLYGNIYEQCLEDMSSLCGIGMKIMVLVDSNHSEESMTRMSTTEFFVFLNQSLIYWLSKKQISCETSTFDSKINKLKHVIEYV